MLVAAHCKACNLGCSYFLCTLLFLVIWLVPAYVIAGAVIDHDDDDDYYSSSSYAGVVSPSPVP